MIWYIAVTIFYYDLNEPLLTSYLGGTFTNEARCIRFLNENRKELNQSFENVFAEYEYKGTMNSMEAYRSECKPYSPSIEA